MSQKSKNRYKYGLKKDEFDLDPEEHRDPAYRGWLAYQEFLDAWCDANLWDDDDRDNFDREMASEPFTEGERMKDQLRDRFLWF